MEKQDIRLIFIEGYLIHFGVLIESKPILVLIIQVFFGDKGTKLELVPDLGRFIRIWLIWSLLYLIIMNILWRWRDRHFVPVLKLFIEEIYDRINIIEYI